MADLDKLAADAKDDLKNVALAKLTGTETDDETKGRFSSWKAIAIVIGSGLGLLFLASTLFGLIRWLIGVALLAGLGYGAYLLVRPKVRALLDAQRVAREAKDAERRQLQAAKDAVTAEEKKRAALEDELARLREKAAKS